VIETCALLLVITRSLVEVTLALLAKLPELPPATITDI
jgi:hypothetical protein